ncbi:hypothetical protein PMG11_00171 [Penicillium brasilianum]|uniref:Uncharacterized protein n=1 Tax=Penicillium brasilianum TaxID=104259 RepID=A0A0F7TBL6_PENBI|nr:hypothetical protein PMG11_00171 [Penicillium brasilianum]
MCPVKLLRPPRSLSIHPPRLSSIVENNDSVQPDDQQVLDALEQSRDYWYHVASLADVLLRRGLASECTNPCHALHSLPKFQGRLRETFQVGSSNCDRVKREKSNQTLLQIGISVAIPYTFDGRVFNSWIGTKDETSTGANYLGILTLGWCYILSARFVEIHGEGASMRYTKSVAECYSEDIPQSSETYIVDVGELDEEVIRWWSAILAQHEGWEGVVDQKGNRKVLTPWTISRTCKKSFGIKQKRPSSAFFDTPLHSDRAFEVLAGFASLHELGSQFPIALAIAMTFPTQNLCLGCPTAISKLSRGEEINNLYRCDPVNVGEFE